MSNQNAYANMMTDIIIIKVNWRFSNFDFTFLKTRKFRLKCSTKQFELSHCMKWFQMN